MTLSAVRPNIASMKGYVPGEQLNQPDIVKLNTNENPYPPSPLVLEALRQALTGDILRKYPQPLGDTFRAAASRVLGVPPEAIVIGNGSDDVLTILTRTFVPERGQIVSLTPSYILYKSLAEIQNATFTQVPFCPNWDLPFPWPELNADLTFLPNPNSPSGTVVQPNSIQRLLQSLSGPLVLDEAYVDFAEWQGLGLLQNYSNLIITRSLSKFYSLAGMRFGFAIASPDLVQEFNKVKDSYNCDALSLVAATAAIQDQSYYADLRSKILATRGRMVAELSDLGFKVTPSQANFVWCIHPERPAKPIADALKAHKILIRYMNYSGFGDGLRISVGSDREIDRLLEALRTVLKK